MIEARGLARTFRSRGRTVEAVRGVDLDVAAGELVGFLGPNGAGKTTTLRMLTTLLRPTSGEATVAGCDLAKDPVGVRRRIGYVAQGGGTTPELKVIEEMVLQGRFYGLSKSDSAARAADLMKRLDIADLDDRVIKTLSGGQRRRLDVALGLLHDPRLVFLDEPSTGLDPQSRANLWGHIKALRDEHDTTVFLTTHYLDEADALCDRILVIDHSNIVAQGTPNELKAQASGDRVEVGVPDQHVAATSELVRKLPDAGEISTVEGIVRFRVPRGDTAVPELLRALDGADIPMTSVQVHRPSLDDVFLTLTRRTLRDAESAVESEPAPAADAEKKEKEPTDVA